ncbi:MAG: hypothetical protein CV087_09775 [Candidatus Brocadia sp. WS118]|nr:MAG: hypothetical protein CV087_09775 [Candidatus Brocadia sp. WS118]
MTFASLFTGGGGADTGAKNAGFELAWGLEKEPETTEVANMNLCSHVRVVDILNANPFDFPKVDLLHASSPCPSFSVAKSNRSETDLDIAMAEKVAEFIRVLQPEFFTLENVRGYASGFLPSKAKNKLVCKSFGLILAELEKSGYKVDYQVVDAANFGVPQNRKRLLLRASKSGWLPDLPKKEAWKGWYQAIEDLIPSLPESRFANWQLKRLPKELIESLLVGGANTSDSSFDPKWGRNGNWHSKARQKNLPAFSVSASASLAQTKAFIADGQSNNGQSTLTIRNDDEPIFTIPAHAAKHKMWAFLVNGTSSMEIRNNSQPAAAQVASTRSYDQKAWLEQGRIVSMTSRALARFQTFPDWYKLPEKNSLACKIIGNAVPCLMYEKLAKQFLGK